MAFAALLVPFALADHNDGSGAAGAAAQHPAGAHHPGGAGARRAAGAAPPTPPSPQAAITIAPGATTKPIPRSYFGISTEYWALPLFERNMPVFERVLSLLHIPGNGPLVVRIGGDSADHSFWRRRWRRMPHWAFELTPAYLSRLNTLVGRDHVRLIVDLNLLTDTPLTAAAWARAAETSLPHGSIVGFEVGNEPDLYSRRYWVATIARSPLRTATLPLELSPSTYVQDFSAYARVLGEHAPGIPLVGPAVAHPRVSLPFVTALVEQERSELGAVSGHLYPYSACVKRPRSADYPTVARLLSRQATSAFATDIASAVAVAHDTGLAFRLTEFNSVTCGGKAQVSDSFATALWAPDALFTALRAGADGANLHVRANAINPPFALSRAGLTARPLLYGLIMFRRMLGPQAHLVQLHLAAAPTLNLSAWAVETRRDVLHVLVIDKDSRSVRVVLHLPTTGPATVQRLLAPSPYSRDGVTLNGQRLSSAGAWTGTPRTETISPDTRGYTLIVPRRSAALVSVRISPRSEHHGRVAVAKHPILAVGLHRARKH